MFSSALVDCCMPVSYTDTLQRTRRGSQNNLENSGTSRLNLPAFILFHRGGTERARERERREGVRERKREGERKIQIVHLQQRPSYFDPCTSFLLNTWVSCIRVATSQDGFFPLVQQERSKCLASEPKCCASLSWLNIPMHQFCHVRCSTLCPYVSYLFFLSVC